MSLPLVTVPSLTPYCSSATQFISGTHNDDTGVFPSIRVHPRLPLLQISRAHRPRSVKFERNNFIWCAHFYALSFVLSAYIQVPFPHAYIQRLFCQDFRFPHLLTQHIHCLLFMSRDIQKLPKSLGFANYSVWAHQLFFKFKKLWKTFVIFADSSSPWYRREAPGILVASSTARRRERRTWRKHHSARFIFNNPISPIHNGLLRYDGTSRQP